MRGHLEARGKNVWRAKVYLGRVDGKNKRYLQRTIHGSKRQAEDVMNELLVEAGQSSNEIVDGTFGDLAREVARALFGDALTDDVARIPAIARPIDPSQDLAERECAPSVPPTSTPSMPTFAVEEEREAYRSALRASAMCMR